MAHTEEAGVYSPVSRLARREAQRFYAVITGIRPVQEIRQPLEAVSDPKSAILRKLLVDESARASYDAISNLNLVTNLAKVTQGSTSGWD